MPFSWIFCNTTIQPFYARVSLTALVMFWENTRIFIIQKSQDCRCCVIFSFLFCKNRNTDKGSFGYEPFNCQSSKAGKEVSRVREQVVIPSPSDRVCRSSNRNETDCFLFAKWTTLVWLPRAMILCPSIDGLLFARPTRLPTLEPSLASLLASDGDGERERRCGCKVKIEKSPR